jgi:hypothetical protein
MNLMKLELGQHRCPTAMRMVMEGVKHFSKAEDTHLLISTIEPSIDRDLTALLDRYPNMLIQQRQEGEGAVRYLLVAKK